MNLKQILCAFMKVNGKLMLIKIFEDGQRRFGPREWSPNIKRLEEACGADILAPGFPAQMIDDEAEETGYEIIPKY